MLAPFLPTSGLAVWPLAMPGITGTSVSNKSCSSKLPDGFAEVVLNHNKNHEDRSSHKTAYWGGGGRGGMRKGMECLWDLL